ncbi:MAG TPA: GGDEF domain-containing protein [Anaerolineales bacterium]|nr:GGDEF domain-containing protein [Anaerolineales bacterium]
MRKILRRYGIAVTSLGLTCLSILLSLLIASSLTGLQGDRLDGSGLLISILSLALITPLLSWQTLSLLARLDAAEHKLQIQSITDELTQVYNRRHSVEYADRELKRVRRFGGTFTIASLDLDNFKFVNDTHGHLIADQILVSLCRICCSCVREADVFARYGDDEFVLLLPETGRQQAQILLQRILETLSITTFPLRGAEICIAVSVRAATLEPQMADVDALLSQADQALYQAKRNGGDQFAFYHPSGAALSTAGYLEIDVSPVKAKLDDVELQCSTGNPGQ